MKLLTDTYLPGFDLLHHGVCSPLDLSHRLHHPTKSLFKLNLLSKLHARYSQFLKLEHLDFLFWCLSICRACEQEEEAPHNVSTLGSPQHLLATKQVRCSRRRPLLAFCQSHQNIMDGCSNAHLQCSLVHILSRNSTKNLVFAFHSDLTLWKWKI